MSLHGMNIGHLDHCVEDAPPGRALAAHLDRAFKRQDISSAHAAKWLGVPEYDVQYRRLGIPVPP